MTPQNIRVSGEVHPLFNGVKQGYHDRGSIRR
jgi:hypothetical protein